MLLLTVGFLPFISLCRHLSPAALPHIASLPDLRVLRLHHTSMVLRDEELNLLGSNCHHLTQLHVDSCHIQLPPRSGAAAVLPMPVATASRGGGGVYTSGAAAAGGDGAGTGASLGQCLFNSTSSGAHSSSSSTFGQGDGNSSSSSSSRDWPPLKSLSLYASCSRSDIQQLLDGLPKLEQLSLSYVGAANDIAQQLEHCRCPLTQLTLQSCGRFQDVGFRSLGRLTGLQELHLDVALGSCSQVEVALTSLTGLTKLVLERLTLGHDSDKQAAAASSGRVYHQQEEVNAAEGREEVALGRGCASDSSSSSSSRGKGRGRQLQWMLWGQQHGLREIGFIASSELMNAQLLVLPGFLIQLQQLHVLGCKQVTQQLQELVEQQGENRRVEVGWKP